MHSVYNLLKAKEGKKQTNSKTVINWKPEHQAAVNEVIDYLKSPEVISYPDFQHPFVVHCDASETGLGAVLYQKVDDKLKIVSFASRTLSPAEKNYFLHSGKLEFLALKWCITEKFHDYLIHGPAFEVITDNNPLTYVLTSAKLNATGQRWVNQLANFNFSIKYHAGKTHVDADYMSRHPLDELKAVEAKADTKVKAEDVDIVFSDSCRSPAEVLCLDVDLLSVEEPTGLRLLPAEIMAQQQVDEVIKPIYDIVCGGGVVEKTVRKQLSKDSNILLKQLSKLSVENGVLVRKTKTFNQIVLPKKFHPIVYSELHEKLGHVGSEKVLELARSRFYWPKMSNHIEFYIRNQCKCLIAKKPNRADRAPLVPITLEAKFPFEWVSVDFLHLDRAKGGFEYALIVTDHFTRFTQIYGTKKKSALAAAEKIYNEYVPKFGLPLRIHSDQGGEFCNKLHSRLQQLAGICASRTTPYHPQSNGQVERVNRTVINMLKTLSEKEKQNWKAFLPKLAFAINTTVNKSTTFSPYFLMFGRSPVLPIDLIFGIEPKTGPEKMRQSYEKFVEEWQSSMKQAFDVVRRRAEKSAEIGKRGYDKKVYGSEIMVGERVLVRNRERGGTGKLRTHWENRIYVVVEKDPNVPVYTVRPESGRQSIKRVHRNELLGCTFLVGQEQKLRTAPVTHKKKEKVVTLPSGSAQTQKETMMGKSKSGKTAVGKSKCGKTTNVQDSPGEVCSSSDSEEEGVVVRGPERIVDSDDSMELETVVQDNNGENAANEQDTDHDLESLCVELSSSDDLEDEDRTFQYEEGDERGLTSWNPDSADEENSVSDQSSTDTQTDDESVGRRPVRVRQAPRHFTYDELGGNPILR